LPKEAIVLRSLLVGCVALVAGSGIAAAAAQDDVKAAAEKLAAADNYSWKSTVQAAGGNNNRAPGPTEGKAEKDGYIVLTITRGDNTLEIVKKGDKVAIKTPDGWQSAAELTAAPAPDANAGAPPAGGAPNPARFAARMAQNFQPPAKTAADLADGAKDLTASGDTITGSLTEEAAKKALSFGGRRGGPNANANAAGPEITNPKGDVKFTVKDGTLAGYELHVTGSVSFNGNSRDVDRTTTVTISDVGSTKVEVPDEAKKKLE
jgi:outer membrane lipoprotein-sorting protein